MTQAVTTLTVGTRGQGMYDITDRVVTWAGGQAVRTGLLTLFIRHTSASLVIQENADPDVLSDLNAFFHRLVPEDEQLYRHVMEGADDMPAHIRAVLTATHLAIPLLDGRLALGTWQGIYVFEHRKAPHERSVVAHLSGE